MRKAYFFLLCGSIHCILEIFGGSVKEYVALCGRFGGI
jgi:hypothetical protein